MAETLLAVLLLLLLLVLRVLMSVITVVAIFMQTNVVGRFERFVGEQVVAEVGTVVGQWTSAFEIRLGVALLKKKRKVCCYKIK